MIDLRHICPESARDGKIGTLCGLTLTPAALGGTPETPEEAERIVATYLALPHCDECLRLAIKKALLAVAPKGFTLDEETLEAAVRARLGR